MIVINDQTKWIFRLACYAIVLVFSYLAVAMLSDMSVRRKASKFCHAIIEGDNSNYLADAAREVGADLPENPWREHRNAEKWLRAEFPGLPPFNGYMCTVKASNDLIVSREFSEFKRIDQ